MPGSHLTVTANSITVAQEKMIYGRRQAEHLKGNSFLTKAESVSNFWTTARNLLANALCILKVI
ncbi:hypothetical protein D3C80_893200 [compost metagenome]